MLDENANFGGQSATGRPYGMDWHCSLKGSQKTDDGMLADFLEACRMDALLALEFVQPEEEAADVAADDGGGFPMDKDVRVEKNPHRRPRIHCRDLTSL
jgi:hypothetical protein